MLDIIRKKASAWLTKIIFGIIIIVFVFFFGYSRMANRSGGGGKAIVATVNGNNIGRAEFQLAYDNTYKMYQNIFKNETGELPEGVQKSVTGSTMNQLIQQSVLKDVGAKLGLTPTALEIAETIKDSPVSKDEKGEFDEFSYKHRFLPYFSQKYGIDYEYLVAGDIQAANVQNLFTSAGKAPFAQSQYNLEKTKWTFEVSEFESEAVAKEGKVSGTPKKVGPVNIAERNQVLPGNEDEAIWEKIFTLNSASPALKDPFASGGKWYKVKIVKIDVPSPDSWEKEKAAYLKQAETVAQNESFKNFLAEKSKEAKIKTFIEQ